MRAPARAIVSVYGDTRAMADRDPPPAPLRRPVRWLLTPDVFGYAKQSLLHAFYGGELDPRDWMRIEDGHAHVEDASADAGRERALATATVEPPASGELWFDYVADTGDGGVAMYTVAYLCQATLAIDGGAACERAALVGRRIAVPPAGAPAPDAMALPRGQFLMVGGDTAYHVADEATIAARVQGPFVRAVHDLARLQPDQPPRRLYGIPGNHDYYDQLIGFGRMFRHPVTAPGQPGPGGRTPPLAIPGLERVQEASYLAITLPWGWQLWGLDVNAWLDARQEWYFRSLPSPRKLILATPSPPIVHHAVAIDAAHRDAVTRLDLAPWFDGGQPTAGACRLDLSGDTHHYARYQPGAAVDGPSTPVGLGCTTAQAAPAPYLAVVSGAGGAFHHPSFVRHGAAPTQAQYPQPAVSRRAVAARLFSPLQLLGGGLVWIIPLFLALFLGAGATRSEGTRWVGDRVLAALAIDHEAALGGGGLRAIAPSEPDELVGSLRYLGFAVGALVLLFLALRMRGVRFSPAQRRRPALLDRWLGPDDGGLRRGLTYALAVTGMLLPFLSPFFIEAPLADALWFDGGWFGISLFALLTSLGLGVVGGAGHRPAGRVAFVLLGLGHGLVQTFTAFVVARLALATWWLVPAMIGVIALGFGLGRIAMAAGARAPILAAIAGGAWLGALAVAVLGADGVAVYPASTAGLLALLALTVVLTIASSVVHLGWYLAISAAGNGHANEVGGAARLESFRQFIRFRVTPDRVTGFVIACDQPSADPQAIHAYVVDVFEVGPTA
jgi:hypothetical protein